jgi:hypothetical protein
MHCNYCCVRLLLLVFTLGALLPDAESNEDFAGQMKSIIIEAIKQRWTDLQHVSATNIKDAIVDRQVFLDDEDSSDEPNIGDNDYGEYQYISDDETSTGSDNRQVFLDDEDSADDPNIGINDYGEYEYLQDNDRDANTEFSTENDVTEPIVEEEGKRNNADYGAEERNVPSTTQISWILPTICNYMPNLSQCFYYRTTESPDVNKERKLDVMISDGNNDNTKTDYDRDINDINDGLTGLNVDSEMMKGERESETGNTNDSENGDKENSEEVENKNISIDQYDSLSPKELLDSILLIDRIIA